MIYFDNNATTAMLPSVMEAMRPYCADPLLSGNPSSMHRWGQNAKNAVEAARAQMASFIGCEANEIIFTASGSESVALAIQGVAYSAQDQNKGRHILTSAVEHDCVLHTCQYLEKHGWQVTFVPVDSTGRVHPEEVAKALRPDTVLVSIMHANNEVGTLEPIGEISNLCREKEILFHTDAVQTAGKIPVDVNVLGVDLLSLAAHKFHGPKGAGVLYVRKGTRLNPYIHGHQEHQRRAGTENVPAIVGCAAAANTAQQDMEKNARAAAFLRDRLENGILERIPQCQRNGHPSQRIPGTSNISFEAVENEACAVMLDLEGIAVSTGSACASGSTKASHVLQAMGLNYVLAQSAIRFSLSPLNTQEEVDHVLTILPDRIQRLRSLSPIWKET